MRLIRKIVRRIVIDRDKRVCYICGGVGKTLDHVVPLQKGGMTQPYNMACCCKRCNEVKGNMQIWELVRHIKGHRERFEYISDDRLEKLEKYSEQTKSRYYDSDRRANVR